MERPGSPRRHVFQELVAPVCAVLLVTSACSPIPPPQPEDPLVARGREIFFNETFDGNGRTCGTCHPASNNFTLDPTFIAALPEDDPLFAAETDTALTHDFENTILMREDAMILENLDGFEDLHNRFTMRGVPHILGLRHSVDSRDGPHTGWSGDGAPGDGSLRSFAVGAVIQHFTRSLARIPGVDFRLPNDEELDALEAFQLSLGRQEELSLPLPLKDRVSVRGQEIFMDPQVGKCAICHLNAGANVDPDFFEPGAGNLTFDTGVEDLPDQPADLTGELVPPDDGLGTPGNGEFNTPSLVEAADTGPFFHNNSVATLEAAVGFYDGDSFNESPAGGLLEELTGDTIELDATQIGAIAAFLRDINTLENIRQSVEFLQSFADGRYLGNEVFDQLLQRAIDETDDAIMVLATGGRHPIALAHLREARRLTMAAIDKQASPARLVREAIREQERARDQLVEPAAVLDSRRTP